MQTAGQNKGRRRLMQHVNDHTFKTEVLESPHPVLVMFYADWCSKCAMMKPIVEDLETVYAGKYKFCSVDIEESTHLSSEYESDLVPAFVFFCDGVPIAGFEGLVSEDIFEVRLLEIFE